MKPKSIITVILLAFVIVSVGALVLKETRNRAPAAAPAGLEATATTDAADHKIVVYYFHGNVRCQTCRKIEAYTAESVTTGFTNEMASGRLEWRRANVDEGDHEHFVQDYALTTRSVVLVETRAGKQVRWKNLARVWELVGDKAAFQQYVADETRGYLVKGTE